MTQIWNIVKRVKLETSHEKNCNKDGLFSFKASQVTAIENYLQMKPSYIIMKNITRENLKTAAEMFIYLCTCPGNNGEWKMENWFKSWYTFYSYLFQKQSTYQIILTLNRMMKSSLPQNKDGKLMAETIFKKLSPLLSLKYEEIQSMLPLEGRNVYVTGEDHKTIFKKGGNYLYQNHSLHLSLSTFILI